MGPSATALVERNNILEAEVRHVRGQNVELSSRLNIATNELRWFFFTFKVFPTFLVFQEIIYSSTTFYLCQNLSLSEVKEI